MLFSLYERRLRQLCAARRAGGAEWARGLSNGGGDRRKVRSLSSQEKGVGGKGEGASRVGQRNRDLERTGMVKGGEKKQGEGGAGGGGALAENGWFI